jgi:aryl-alcohol dehydrogenase-like predicted oxidoreductase
MATFQASLTWTSLCLTAEAYGNGHGEAVIGEALQRRRDKWIIATKVRPNQGIDADTPDEAAVRKRITEACEQSLQRLQTDYIDIYQLHAIPYPWAMPIAMGTLAQLREAGKIRWYGISTNNREAIDQLRAYGPLQVLQIGYNLLERRADALLHWARAENMGTFIRVPLAKGMLTGKYSGPQRSPRHRGIITMSASSDRLRWMACRNCPSLASYRRPPVRWCKPPCALCSIIPACRRSSLAPRRVSKSRKISAPRPSQH